MGTLHRGLVISSALRTIRYPMGMFGYLRMAQDADPKAFSYTYADSTVLVDSKNLWNKFLTKRPMAIAQYSVL